MMFFEKAIAKITAMTDANEHVENIKRGIIFLSFLTEDDTEADEILFTLEVQIEQVIADYANTWYMTPENSAKRREIYQNMMELAKILLTPEDYAKFYSAF